MHPSVGTECQPSSITQQRQQTCQVLLIIQLKDIFQPFQPGIALFNFCWWKCLKLVVGFVEVLSPISSRSCSLSLPSMGWSYGSCCPLLQLFATAKTATLTTAPTSPAATGKGTGNCLRASHIPQSTRTNNAGLRKTLPTPFPTCCA